MDLYTIKEEAYAGTIVLTLAVEGVYTSTRTVYANDPGAYRDALLDLTIEYVAWLQNTDELEG